MKRINKVFYKGKHILCVSYNRENEDEIFETLIELQDLIVKENKPVMLILDISSTYLYKEALLVSSRILKKVRYFLDKSAVIGADGMQKNVLFGLNTMLGKEVQLFYNQEDAKEWMVA